MPRRHDKILAYALSIGISNVSLRNSVDELCALIHSRLASQAIQTAQTAQTIQTDQAVQAGQTIHDTPPVVPNSESSIPLFSSVQSSQSSMLLPDSAQCLQSDLQFDRNKKRTHEQLMCQAEQMHVPVPNVPDPAIQRLISQVQNRNRNTRYRARQRTQLQQQTQESEMAVCIAEHERMISQPFVVCPCCGTKEPSDQFKQSKFPAFYNLGVAGSEQQCVSVCHFCIKFEKRRQTTDKQDESDAECEWEKGEDEDVRRAPKRRVYRHKECPCQPKNRLCVENMPSILKELNWMEMQIVRYICPCRTLLFLPQGQSGTKGQVVYLPRSPE